MLTSDIKNRIIKTAATAVAFIMLAIPLTSCGKDEGTVIPADYGSYGADVARELANSFPNRTAYSSQESEAGQYIAQQMRDLGYEPVVQQVSGDFGQTSNNIYVKIEGTGFYVDDGFGNYSLKRRIAVIGAHYDDMLSAFDDDGSEYKYDGISDNASGVGCLLTCLAHAGEYADMGFDVYIVAFGASGNDYAGARTFLGSLSPEEIASIDVMYCIDSIYAGDKVYASAGYNSLNDQNRYQMRRKLYQTYDVCYANTLYSNYRFDILYNESGIAMDLDGNGTIDRYNEVSANKSDYVPFDNAGIPIVYIDSFDYNFDKFESMKDTKNLNLQAMGGQVRGTSLDSAELLDSVLRQDDIDEDEDGIPEKSGDLLQIRINAVAFVILETLSKGSDFGMTPSQYEDYLKTPETESSEAVTDTSYIEG